MRQNINKIIGPVLVAAVMIYWGFTTILQKHAMLYMSSTAYIMVRFVLAAVLVLPVYWVRLRKAANRSLVLHGCILGLLELIPMETSMLALKYTTAANSVFISQLSFVFVPLIQCMVRRRLPEKKLVITIAALLAGLAVFADIRNTDIGTGAVFSVITALFHSFHILCIKRFSKTDDGELLGALQILFCAIFSVPVWLVKPCTITWCTDSVIVLFLTGVIGTAVCFVAHVAGLTRTNPVNASFLGLLQPIFAMIGGAIIMNERGQFESITPNMLIGSTVILVSLTLFLISGSTHASFSKRTKN